MQKDIISVIGLGYVGLPVAVAFGKKFEVMGFDVNKNRIEELQNNEDKTLEVTTEELANTSIHYTTDIEALKRANFYIVAVPTPLDDAKAPNMGMVHSASVSVGKVLSVGDIVVYESTVYPGATEEECVPLLEREFGLKCGEDFFVGYSPERINPGDKEHTFTKIQKVVSGQDEKTLKKISKIYAQVVEAGVFEAGSIKVAKAAKIIENTQRDLNIAFMNELSIIFDKMGIDTKQVLEAAGTKWNFLNFHPGLVGGHCIGVDPFYLTYKAKKLGYHPEVILAGRKINDSMGEYVVKKAVELMIKSGLNIVGSEVNLVGLTFKENCPDIRNTRVLDIYKAFTNLGLKVNISDPVADPSEVENEFGVSPIPMNEIGPQKILVLAVPHKQIFSEYNWNHWVSEEGVLIDVKNSIPKDEIVNKVRGSWSL